MKGTKGQGQGQCWMEGLGNRTTHNWLTCKRDMDSVSVKCKVSTSMIDETSRQAMATYIILQVEVD